MVNLNVQGMVFDVQSFSIHDGPGIRTIVFLKGCPLRCLWCANPEGQKKYPEISYHDVKCKGCLDCIKDSAGLLSANSESSIITINRDKILENSNLDFIDNCPNSALEVKGKLMSVKEVMKKIKRDLPYYRGEGGITLSGGDPTFQPEFALEILKACKEEYISTAIESAMFTSLDIVEKFISLTDYFLTDIKHMDSQKHKELTGVPNEHILRNIARLAKSSEVIIRIPIIPTLNDSEENIKNTAIFCRENGIERINILPYHKLGIAKYKQIGLPYKMPNLNPPDEKSMENLQDLIEKNGVKCVIG